jgi:hypothetical protein
MLHAPVGHLFRPIRDSSHFRTIHLVVIRCAVLVLVVRLMSPAFYYFLLSALES